MRTDNWAADNEMSNYQPDALRKFLSEPDNLLLLAYDGDKIAGAVIAHELKHPDGDNHFYVHELDTHPDYRRQGVGRMMMDELVKISKNRGCAELWLGTETDNIAAQKLYESLGPTETEQTITYSYKL